MPKNAAKQQSVQLSTTITITLSESEGENRSGALLIARGELAHVRQFTYSTLSDLPAVIKEAMLALAAIEAEPPVIIETSIASPPTKSAAKPEAPAEPTVDVLLKKGTKAVRISHLKIVGGETDAAAYKQATLLAGKLIDGKLWDGETPIRFTDVYATASKMKYLTERDLSLFSLEDFVQAGAGESEPDTTKTVITDNGYSKTGEFLEETPLFTEA